ncbi:hypothetical protein THAOC_27090 [Thalassiosira oceanica]|uniref:Myb-like domain-containing protein n=1 Tax=Thalassiosira oceanica TaxID=159749 RepID=K0RX94_THAOC|nr:hypothetical protein THAOC_27090 [Thalassiosira oceanica]|eukprot:EJK53476.1 hypothetical protein THAOC_27090 [Thalassiosira oceanica]
MDSNDDKHFGFMEALVGRARKTLFITDPENTSDAANGKPARSGKPRSSRGRSSATSSLAKIDSNQGKGKENKAPAAIGEISKCATEGPGKCADKRRSLKQTGTCSLSACNSSESSGHEIAKIKRGLGANGTPGKLETIWKAHATDLEHAGVPGRNANEAHIEQDTKHAPKVSSLMALPASTQKTQKSNFPARGGRNKTASSSTLPKGDPGDSVSDLLNKLSIEGKSSVCFTPSTTRVRTSLMAGTITSPPAAQRCSTLSDNGGFFSERSPMPDLNPKKRFDSKKTPDCKFLQAGGSPMDTSLSPMSPSPREGKSSPVEPTQTSDHAKRRARLFCDEVETHVDEANVRKPGSAVLEVEAPTPRFPKRSEAVLPKVHLETGGIAHLEKPVVESVKAVPIDAEILCKATKQAPIEDNGNAAQLAVRRSTRESKQTDRLTVSSWRGKKKATSDGQDSPRSDEGVACAVESSFEQPVFKDAPSEELNQANSSENSNDGAGMRRSARESKQTDRLTVTWKKCNVTSRSDRSKSAGDGVENDNVENDDGKTPEVPKEKTAKLEVKGLPSPKREPDVPSPPTSDDSADAWSADEMRRLRTAQKEVDPTSILYWHEVARIVGNTKSPSECQRKWQCTIATPKPRRRELPDQSVAHSENDDAADGDDEDDLFNSTPMRIVCEEDRFTNFNIGEGGCQFSPLKQDALSDVQKPLRKGYNKYISNLKRDIKKKGTRPTGPKTNATASKVWAEPRRWELSCSFSVGEDEDSCDDDIWDDFNEETE